MPRISPMLWFAMACIAAGLVGMQAATERFISPESGLGYWLGITGGSAMLLLLWYPARKRLPWLGFSGSVKNWFRLHMALGLLGPLLVLFHSNFSLGATNSNVALACMLVVSLSGLFGRYFYSRIHLEFYGSKATLAQLQANAQRVRNDTTKLQLLPGLSGKLDETEAALLRAVARLPLILRPGVTLWRMWHARRDFGRYIEATLAVAPKQRAELLAHERLLAQRMVEERLEALRRVVDFTAYERLFAAWHILHLPLFIMLLLAGIIHVVAVHVY